MLTVHHEKSFAPALLKSLLITYLIILSLEKEIIVLEKGLEKVFNFGLKNLSEPFINDSFCTKNHTR